MKILCTIMMFLITISANAGFINFSHVKLTCSVREILGTPPQSSTIVDVDLYLCNGSLYSIECKDFNLDYNLSTNEDTHIIKNGLDFTGENWVINVQHNPYKIAYLRGKSSCNEKIDEHLGQIMLFNGNKTEAILRLIAIKSFETEEQEWKIFQVPATQNIQDDYFYQLLMKWGKRNN